MVAMATSRPRFCVWSEEEGRDKGVKEGYEKGPEGLEGCVCARQAWDD